MIAVALAVVGGGFIGIRKPLATYLYYLGRDYVDAGDLGKAKVVLERSLLMNPSYRPAVEELGTIYQRRGDREKAKTYLDKSISLKSSKYSVWLDRASYATTLEERKQILIGLENVLNQEPKNGGLHFAAGMIALSTGELEQARNHFSLARDLDPKNRIRYSMAIADAFLREDKPAAAITELEKVDTKSLDNSAKSNLKAMLAVAYARAGRDNEGLALALEAKALDSQSSSPYEALAFIYQRLGDKEKAIQALEQFLAVASDDRMTPQSVIEKAQKTLSELKLP